MNWEKMAADPLSRKIYTVEISVADPQNPSAEREILRFSSDTIDPALTDEFYEPCVKSLPTLTRSVQVLTLGRTACAFGTLILLTGGGHLDETISSRLIAGSPVSIKMGFGGLAVSEFREVFAGRIGGSPSWGDETLSCPLVDPMRDLLEKKMFSLTELSGRLPDVLHNLLGMVGYNGRINTQLWDSWAAENDFEIWLPISAGQSVGAALNQLLPPLGCWFGLDASGLFAVGTHQPPDEVPEFTPLFRSVTLSYYTATGDDPATSSLVWDNTTMTPEEYEAGIDSWQTTYLTAQDDAQTVLQRWAGLKFSPAFPAGYTPFSPGCRFDELDGSLPGIVSYLLDLVGIDSGQRDSQMWDSWAAQNDFSVWTKISATQSVGSVLDLLLGPLGCWYGFSRDGSFRVGTFAEPDQDATPELTLTDINLFEFSSKNHGKRHWKISVSYYTATGTSPETAVEEWEDEAVRELNSSASEASKQTALTAQADALTVLQRWQDLFSVRRLLASGRAAAELFAVNIGDQLRVTRDRMGVDHIYRVQKITDNMNKNNVLLELFK